ncbi:MAG TPA: excalibur calcium-binding domain-containing protein [Jiangellaceae bacterium]|jgi:hypothetical protein|nr:excalibur calcium-binding domain-containing protein [Jiangellaceae bacterium]
MAISGPDAQPPSIESTERRTTPWYRRWWALTLGGILIVSVIGNAFGDDSATSIAGDPPTVSATSSPSQQERTAPAEPATESATILTATPGPAYTGRVRVIGPDEYDLDRDGDGVGCE